MEPILYDLAIILATGGLVSLIFRKIQQPIVLGYLLAGMLVGPHTTPKLLSDLPNIQTWAEIGVIFLMFALGLEFTFHKLRRIGNNALITAVFEVSLMLFLGYAAGRFLGLKNIDSIFLGGMLAISSTTIIIKTFEGLQLKGHRFAESVFGVLIVEDLFAILLLVAFATVGTQAALGWELLYSGLQLVLVVGGWFLIGYFFIPTFFHFTRKIVDDESLTVLGSGLCLVLAVIAHRFNYSPALGAFIMGSILAETREAQRLETLIRPLKNLFASIFFVSVGMLIDPRSLISNAGTVVGISTLVIVGKAVGATMGAIASGEPLKRSVRIGMSLGQIGEFSFIIATLGLSLGIDSKLYSLAVGVSLLTTFTTPYLVSFSERASNFIEKKVPDRALLFLSKYSLWMQQPREENVYFKPGARFFLNGIVVTLIFALIGRLNLIEYQALEWLGAILASAPFVWGMFFSFRSTRRAFLIFFGQLATILWLGILSAAFFASFWAFVVTLLIASGFFSLSYRRLERSYAWFENMLLSNLKDDGKSKRQAANKLLPWDLRLVQVVLHPNSRLCGLSLKDSEVRGKFGISIVAIHRGDTFLPSPKATDPLFPHDTLLVLGGEPQIEQFRKDAEYPTIREGKAKTFADYALSRVLITANNPWVGKSIQASNIRKDGLIVGLEKGEDRIVNPDPHTHLAAGDVLWIVGEAK